MDNKIVNALSVDVEEYYHALNFQEGTWGVDSRCFPSRVDESVRRVLGLLAHADIRATFFVLGEVAAGLKPGRRGEEEITLFKSVGLAVQDVAAAARVLQVAEESGAGQIVEI